MERSGALETPSLAAHILSEYWRKMVRAQEERCTTVAFDLETLACSKPFKSAYLCQSGKSAYLCQSGRGWLATRIVLHTTCEPAYTADTHVKNSKMPLFQDKRSHYDSRTRCVGSKSTMSDTRPCCSGFNTTDLRTKNRMRGSSTRRFNLTSESAVHDPLSVPPFERNWRWRAGTISECSRRAQRC